MFKLFAKTIILIVLIALAVSCEPAAPTAVPTTRPAVATATPVSGQLSTN